MLPWTSYFSFRSLGFLICKMGIAAPTFRGWMHKDTGSVQNRPGTRVGCVWVHLLPTWSTVGGRGERAGPLNIGVLETSLILCLPLGAALGSPGIFVDESEEDKKPDSTHI